MAELFGVGRRPEATGHPSCAPGDQGHPPGTVKTQVAANVAGGGGGDRRPKSWLFAATSLVARPGRERFQHPRHFRFAGPSVQ